jgi:hypothetical protein
VQRPVVEPQGQVVDAGAVVVVGADHGAGRFGCKYTVSSPDYNRPAIAKQPRA